MTNFYTCSHCGKSIEINQKDIHENYCLYVPKLEEFDDLIPCEVCNNFINFSDYQEHIESCGTRRAPSMNTLMNTINNYINQMNNPENQNINLNQEPTEEPTYVPSLDPTDPPTTPMI